MKRFVMLSIVLLLGILTYAQHPGGRGAAPGQAPAPGSRLHAQVRYRQNEQACVVSELSPGRLVLEFEQPQRAVTPGQSVVLYDGTVCLGGGIIDASNAPPDHGMEPSGLMESGFFRSGAGSS